MLIIETTCQYGKCGIMFCFGGLLEQHGFENSILKEAIYGCNNAKIILLVETGSKTAMSISATLVSKELF